MFLNILMLLFCHFLRKIKLRGKLFQLYLFNLKYLSFYFF